MLNNKMEHSKCHVPKLRVDDGGKKKEPNARRKGNLKSNMKKKRKE